MQRQDSIGLESLNFTAIGRWWNGAHEIDIVALDGRNTVLAGSCKWTASPMGMRDLRELQGAMEAGQAELRPIDAPWYALFSLKGFEPALADHAA